MELFLFRVDSREKGSDRGNEGRKVGLWMLLRWGECAPVLELGKQINRSEPKGSKTQSFSLLAEKRM